ncbi:MAG: hypothetical protein L6W00_18880 [Lentisphaeria bacterium]|nr:MAG: hypothetical protein L6W00_18880 [Lentisphaeria bacterium]
MRLNRLEIRSCSRPAAVALAALDGLKDLKTAQRYLLVFLNQRIQYRKRF